MLEGEYGEAISIAMKILVAIGEVYGAERLIPIRSAHISGVSYANIGQEGLCFIKKLATGAKVKVLTTVNPTAIDLKLWRLLGIPSDFANKQLEIVRAFLRMGVRESFTCTPYLIGNLPPPLSHVAWGESSAVTYLNSVLGAFSNREGGPSALASSITGRTPLYGLQLLSERTPTARVILRVSPTSTTDFSLLGLSIGLKLREGIPLIENIYGDHSQLKAFAAGLAAASNISMSILKGITPKGTYDLPEISLLERVEIDENELQELREQYCSQIERPDLVFLGCPHYSLKELNFISTLLRGRKVQKDVKVWIAVPRKVYFIASKNGLIESLNRSGVLVIKDMCSVVTPLNELGIRSIVTDSAKAMHYLKLRHRVEVMLTDAVSALNMVMKG